MKTILYLIFFSFITFNCTSTYIIKHDLSAYDQLNKQLDGEKAEITLRNESMVVAENIDIGLRTSSWNEVPFREKVTQDKKTNPINRIIPTANIKNIITKQHGRGALEGLGFGALVFLGIGLMTSRDQSDEGWQMDTWVLLSLPISLISTVTGAVAGHKNLNVLNKPVQQYKKVEITSILQKTDDEIIVIWKTLQINLKKSEYIKFERDQRNNQSEKIYITVPRKVYMQKFLRMMIE